VGLVRFISHPVQSIQGELSVPGDKSISHRAIIFGALAHGTSTIDGFLDGEDCLATLKAFQSMGVSIERPTSQQVIIHGVGKYGLKKPAQIIDCGNSGTSMRLLAGLLSAQSFDSEVTGDESLLKRPMLRVSKPLSQMCADISTSEGKPPLIIKGGQTLKAIHYAMPEASAQVKSCLLLAGMYAQGDTQITEKGVSRDHTELMLNTFSYPIKRIGKTLVLNSASECIASQIKVPGDISSAAFFLVAASIIPGSDVVISNVGVNPTRTGIIALLKQMGADITLLNPRYFGEEPVADLHVKYAPLNSITIAPEMVPLAIDEFPVLFIAAAAARGETRLHGAKELRLKESDRIGVMVEGLQRLGIDATDLDDGALIKGGIIQGGRVDSRGDHRIAMSFAIAGAIAQGPITIDDCSNVATSFPDFVDTANKLHLNLETVVGL
jgi:3-phosphoshikimate 1-carboxyvinyltransferase